MTLSAGLGPFGLMGKLYVDNDVLRIVEHGVSLEIPYADIVSAKAGTFRSTLAIETKEGLHRKLTLFAPIGYKKFAEDIRRRAGLEK